MLRDELMQMACGKKRYCIMNTSSKSSCSGCSPACQLRRSSGGHRMPAAFPFFFFFCIAIVTHSPVPTIQSRFFPPTRVGDRMLAVSCFLPVLGLGWHPDTWLLCFRGEASIVPDWEAPRALKRADKKKYNFACCFP